MKAVKRRYQKGKGRRQQKRDQEDEIAFSDQALASPAQFTFRLPGHRISYNLTALRPYFGDAFCHRFQAAWSKAAVFQRGSTSYNYFKAIRTAFLCIARKGVTDHGSIESAITQGFRDSPTWVPAEKDWGQAITNVGLAILTLSDNSFIKAGSSESRNKKFESLRSAVRWIAEQDLVPDVEIECNRLPEQFGAASKCLATLKFDAGRLNVSGLSASAAAEAFASCNREMLEELRHQLWMELKENYDLFAQGQLLMSDPKVPEVAEAEAFLRTVSREKIRNGDAKALLRLTKKQSLGLALKIYRHKALCGHGLSDKTLAFAGSIIKFPDTQPYYEATTVALNAAFHIILIDTGANPQPVEDIPYDCFDGASQRGKRQVRSLRLTKTRSGGKAVPGHLKENIEETQLFLSTKNTPIRPSGVVVIQIWKELTASMRNDADLTSKRLWVWRKPGWTTARTSLVSMSSDRWPAFLARHSNNEVFGGLPITRQNLRTAVRNVLGEAGNLDIAVEQALLGHSSTKTTFEYLSEGAVRALLVNQIRDFVDTWEAVSVQNVDSAALRLGIPTDELFRRAQLGIENGLAFAMGGSQRGMDLPSGDLPDPALVKKAQEFSVSTVSMTNLELARRALREQFEEMVTLNPQRLVRKWLPWMALVEGYCIRLEQSRFRVQFSKVCRDVETKVLSGEMRVPLLW